MNGKHEDGPCLIQIPLMSGRKHTKTVDRIIWQSRLKASLRIGGFLLMLVGLMFVPACRSELGPKSTIFDRIVMFDRTLTPGTFAEPGTVLIGIGAIAFTASWLVRGDGPFD
jgi:hypothetical protein